jgi:hypothetical protein
MVNDRREVWMNIVLRSTLVLGSSLCLMAAPVLAGPKITVDKPEVDIGAQPEGKVKTVEAVFKIKNTGDATLHIKKVKPG